MPLKVKKPYDKYLDELLRNGSVEISTFGKAAYFMRETRKPHFTIYPIHGRPFGRFAVFANKPMKKIKKKSHGKYAHYTIMRKNWGDLY